MIITLEEQIKKYFPEYRYTDIQFLKFSTAGSGAGKYNKIIFLAFSSIETNPFCCIKTVRTYSENPVIHNGFENLRHLNKLVINSAFEYIFPKAIGLYDDNKEFVFSIESVCDGNKVSINNIDFILNKYFEFQKHISVSNKKKIPILEYFNIFLEKINFSESDSHEIRTYFMSLLQNEKNKICLIPQHGDFTLDNIFINKEGICLVDCDLFGYVDIAGFDLFHFLMRYKQDGFAENLKKYFLRYLKYIGEEKIHLDKDLFFLFFLQDMTIKYDENKFKLRAKDIIGGFEKLI